MPSTNIYCWDTGAIINFVKNYPPHIFPSLCRRVDEMISQQRIFSPKEVFKELGAIDDGVFAWVKARKGMVVDIEAAEIALLPQLVNSNTKWVRDAEKEVADPFIIAMALARGMTVVTSEKHAPYTAGVDNRIPAVCKQHGVLCTNPFGFMEQEGLVF